MNTDTTQSASLAVLETEQKVLAYIRREALFVPGDRVIAACSGGADSMALLLFLLRCRATLGVEVQAAHIDHGIRGAASRADAAFVADFCRRQDVPLFLYDAPASGVTPPAHPSEEWARRLRYDWFDRLAEQQKACIATAHTLSDQAETLLFRLARGSGIHGMGGIAPRRGVYVRPLLCLTRADTEAYCAALGQSYVTDATNADLRYARNRLRQEALPALLAANGGALTAMGRLAEQMRAIDGWVDDEARSLLAAARTPERAYRLAALQMAPDPLLDAALYRLLGKAGPAEERHVVLLRTMIRQGNGALQATSRVRFVVHDGLLCREEAATARALPPQPAQAMRPGRYQLVGGYALEIRIIPVEKYEKFIKNAPKTKKGLNCCADYDKIGKSILLRTRCPGDRFCPPGRGCSKTLKKYLNELAVPPPQRDLLPLLASAHEVLWLWGVGFGDGLRPDSGTKTVLAVWPAE